LTISFKLSEQEKQTIVWNQNRPNRGALQRVPWQKKKKRGLIKFGVVAREKDNHVGGRYACFGLFRPFAAPWRRRDVL
jgi:hypothetical protein